MVAVRLPASNAGLYLPRAPHTTALAPTMPLSAFLAASISVSMAWMLSSTPDSTAGVVSVSRTALAAAGAPLNRTN